MRSCGPLIGVRVELQGNCCLNMRIDQDERYRDLAKAIVLPDHVGRVVLPCANAIHVEVRGKGSPWPRQITNRRARHKSIAGKTAEF